MLLSPEGRSWGAFREWAQKLEAKGSPAWLGLSVSAEKILKIKSAGRQGFDWKRGSDLMGVRSAHCM